MIKLLSRIGVIIKPILHLFIRPMTKKNETKSDNTSELKPCFIITPIGQAGSDTYIKTEGLINSVLTPVLKDFGYYPRPAHKIDNSGSITKQIVDNVINCDLVIANLTGVNPNVMYELAIRHSFGKKVLTLAEIGTQLPFDIQAQRTVFYEDSMHGSEHLKPELSKKLRTLIDESTAETRKNSPVFEAVRDIATLNKLPEDQRGAVSLILSKLNSLEDKVNATVVIGKTGVRYPLNKNPITKYSHRLRVYVANSVVPEQVFQEISSLLFTMGVESSGLSIDRNIVDGTKQYVLRTNVLLPERISIEDIDSRLGYINGVYKVSFSAA